MIVIGLLLSLQLIAPAFAAVSTLTSLPPPNFYVSAGTTSVCRGMVNQVPVVVKNAGIPPTINLGTGNLIGPAMVDIQLSVLNGKSGYYVGNNTAFISSIDPGVNGTGHLSWFVPANASATTNLQLGISYYFNTYYFDTETRNMSFSTQRCAQPMSISTGPNVLISGEIENLRITLKNTATVPLDSVAVDVSAPVADIAQVSSIPMEVGTLAPGATVSLNDSVYVNRNATISFPLNITANYYLNGTFQQVAIDRQALSEGLINLTQSSLTLSPSPASPGGIFSISFVLTNTGTSGASTVTVSSEPISGFNSYGSNSTFVGTIAAAGESPVTLTFVVNSLTKPGTYNIPVVVNYLDGFRNSMRTVVDVPVVVSGSEYLNGTAQGGSGTYIRTSGSGSAAGGGLVTIILLIAVAVLGYLYYKERKRRHAK